MQCYRQKQKPMLPREFERLSILENTKYKDDHPFKFQALEKIKEKVREGNFTKSFSAREIFKETSLRLDKDISKEDLRQMGIVLKDLGCISAKREKGERKWKIPLDWSLNSVQ